MSGDSVTISIELWRVISNAFVIEPIPRKQINRWQLVAVDNFAHTLTDEQLDELYRLGALHLRSTASS